MLNPRFFICHHKKDAFSNPCHRAYKEDASRPTTTPTKHKRGLQVLSSLGETLALHFVRRTLSVPVSSNLFGRIPCFQSSALHRINARNSGKRRLVDASGTALCPQYLLSRIQIRSRIPSSWLVRYVFRLFYTYPVMLTSPRSCVKNRS